MEVCRRHKFGAPGGLALGSFPDVKDHGLSEAYPVSFLALDQTKKFAYVDRKAAIRFYCEAYISHVIHIFTLFHEEFKIESKFKYLANQSSVMWKENLFLYQLIKFIILTSQFESNLFFFFSVIETRH